MVTSMVNGYTRLWPFGIFGFVIREIQAICWDLCHRGQKDIKRNEEDINLKDVSLT